MAWRAAAVVAGGFVGLALVASLALAVAPPGGEIGDEPLSSCWKCHASDSPVPMRSIVSVRPPDQVGAAVGAPFELNVQVQAEWRPPQQPGWPHLPMVQGVLDLGNAPSLSLLGGRVPRIGQTFQGSFQREDANNPLGTQKGTVVVEVPPGTSDLVFTVAPNNTDAQVGPRLRVAIYPGLSHEGAQPAFTAAAPGHGSPAKVSVHGASNITQLGAGSTSWAVVAKYDPVDASGRQVTPVPPPGGMPFTLTLDTFFNLTGTRQQVVLAGQELEAGQATILTWPLRVLRAPTEGESVRLWVNATAHYKHIDGLTPDWGNFSHELTLGVVADGVGAAVAWRPAVVAASSGGLGIPLSRLSEAIGYTASFLLVSSIASGGMFGKASRRGLNRLFQSAKRRVAFHNVLSYWLTLMAAIHGVLFVFQDVYPWTQGILFGGLAILAMLGLGVTGALQVPIIRRWDYETWRWTHYGLTWATLVFTLVHFLLEGANFTPVQNAVGWHGLFPQPGRELA